MPRPSHSDTRYLEMHRGRYRVSVGVPRPLQRVLGTRLKRLLNTDSLAVANRLKWAVVAEMKAEIERVRLKVEGGEAGTAIVAEAMEWREAMAEERAGGGERITADLLLPDRAEEIEERHGTAAAKSFVAVASGKETPIPNLQPAWLAEAGYSGRTESARKQAVRLLVEWCRSSNIPETVEAIDRKTAGRFVSEVFIGKGADPATANKLITGLSAFWTWMEKRGHAEVNPWQRQSLTVKKVKTEEGEGAKRPFTDKEVTALLSGAVDTPTVPLSDLSLLGALSGLRLGEMADLKVRNVRVAGNGLVIRVGVGKTDSATRDVPVHPDALSVVEARLRQADGTDKGPDDYVFHELPEQTSDARPRSAPASQAFTRLRRRLKIDDRMPGRRQARADFHSFRRWFMRKAVNALEAGVTGFTPWTIADVVGHDAEDQPLPLTMGRYPGPAGLETRRACVEAVKLPPGERGG